MPGLPANFNLGLPAFGAPRDLERAVLPLLSTLPALSSGGGSGGPTGAPPNFQVPNILQGGGAQQSTTGLIPGMQNIYSQLLGLNEQKYGQMTNLWNQYAGLQGSMLPGIYQGYGNLTGNVLNALGIGQGASTIGGAAGQALQNTGFGAWGVAAPAAQAIQDVFQQSSGAAQAALIGSGLGNTSEQAGNLNAAALAAGRAYGGLGANLAQTAAGYMGSIGQAGLGAQLAGLAGQVGLGTAAMGDIAGTTFANTAGQLSGYFGGGYNQYPPYNRYGGGSNYGGLQQNPFDQSGPTPMNPYAQTPAEAGGGYGMTNPYVPIPPVQPSMDPYGGTDPSGANWGFGYDPFGNLTGLNGGMGGGAGGTGGIDTSLGFSDWGNLAGLGGGGDLLGGGFGGGAGGLQSIDFSGF